MISIMAEENKTKIDTAVFVGDSIKTFIRDLGFPIFVAILLIYNSWQMQTYLINTNDKRDQQIATLSEAVKQLSISTIRIQEIITENQRVLQEIRISKIVDERTAIKRDRQK